MSINLPVHAVLALVLLAVAVVPSSAVNATTDWTEPGDADVETQLVDWIDTGRDRSLPIKLYLPEGDGPFPVVIFSHGLGGSREAAPYLGEYWASHGFLGVFVQHPGTDRSLFAGATSREEILEDLRSGTRNREMAQARFEDIPFVIDEIERLAASGALPADITRIGMAGHSYGAATTIAVMGRRFGRQMDFTEPRILAGLTLSPTAPPARLPERMHPRLYDRITRPMLHLTGTEDVAAIRPEIDPADRTIPFSLIPSGEQYLIVFEGVTTPSSAAAAARATARRRTGIRRSRRSRRKSRRPSGRRISMAIRTRWRG